MYIVMGEVAYEGDTVIGIFNDLELAKKEILKDLKRQNIEYSVTEEKYLNKFMVFSVNTKSNTWYDAVCVYESELNTVNI